MLENLSLWEYTSIIFLHNFLFKMATNFNALLSTFDLLSKCFSKFGGLNICGNSPLSQLFASILEKTKNHKGSDLDYRPDVATYT